MKNKNKAGLVTKDVVIYQAKSGAIELKGDFGKETIWATQAQIMRIFQIDQSVVSRHIRNVFKDEEVSEKRNMQKMHIANSDRPVTVYSLDVILSVGYRTNSGRAIEFRKWATKTLHSHIVDGYTINRSRIAENYSKFLKAVEEVKKLLPVGGQVDAEDTLELVKLFASTWFSLDAYDKSSLPKKGATRRQVSITAIELENAIKELKQELLAKNQATDLFALERQKDGIASVVGNVFQSFGGADFYQSVEEKAAHLLYFIIKNHPFTDGNKRSGAFAFIWFLRRARILNTSRLTPEALTTLTLLIAESNPSDKERMIGLVLMIV